MPEQHGQAFVLTDLNDAPSHGVQPEASRRQRLSRLWASTTTPTRARVVFPVVFSVILALLLLGFPWVGALFSISLFVAFVPVTDGISSRVVAAVILLSGLVAGAVVLGSTLDLPIGLAAAKSLAAIPGTAAIGVLLVHGGWRRLLPRRDGGVLALFGTIAFAWLLTGATALGRSPESLMGGLSALGWDHQSHFANFAAIYQLDGVWHSNSGVPQPSFDTYPPLEAVLSSLATSLVDNHAVPIASLLARYTQATALVCAIALGTFAWVAAAATREILGERVTGANRAVPPLAGLALGGYMCLGPPLGFFDYGFSNFIYAAALAAAVSWLILAPFARQPLWATAFLAAGVASISLLWTPLVLLLAAAAATLAWRLIRDRNYWKILVAGALMCGALAVPVWQSMRLVPDSAAASGLARTVGAVVGGMPPVPLAQAIGFVIGSISLLVLGSHMRRRAWAAALAVCAGGALLVAAFAAVSLRQGVHPQHSYYWAKAAWALYFVSLPLLGTLVGYALHAAIRWSAAERPRSSLRSERFTTVVAALAVTSLLWSSLAFVNSPGSKSGFVSVPSATDSVIGRWKSFRSIDAGFLVFAASRAIGRGKDEVPIIWDGGDLKQNRWLASLRGQLDGQANAVYDPMPGGPYLQPAADALRQRLSQSPSLKVAVAYFRPESKDLLDPLARDFPLQVRLTRMR